MAKSKFPQSGPKTMEVDIAWLEPEEAKRRTKSRDAMAAVSPDASGVFTKGTYPKKGPPPMPGSTKKGPPPMPVEPVSRGPKTLEVKAEWLEPPSESEPQRRRSRASMAPVKPPPEPEPKSRRSRSMAPTAKAADKKGPPIPRED